MASAARPFTALLLAFLLALCLTGCAMADMATGGAAPKMAEAAPAMDPAPPPPPGVYRSGLADEDSSGAVASTIPVGEPKPTPQSPFGEPGAARSPILIYSASLGIAVNVVADALRDIETMARDNGGFLARRDESSITIRIPAARFDAIVLRIERLGDVVHRNVTAEDVTEEFTDLETRLKSARAVRDRLKELLAKATTVKDSLDIERELGRVMADIERMETRLKYLAGQARYSTITVAVEAKRTETVGNQVRIPVGWLGELGLGRLLDLYAPQ